MNGCVRFAIAVVVGGNRGVRWGVADGAKGAQVRSSAGTAVGDVPTCIFGVPNDGNSAANSS
jgi:hypothetical protein